jgi:hypothetical protein
MKSVKVDTVSVFGPLMLVSEWYLLLSDHPILSIHELTQI